MDMSGGMDLLAATVKALLWSPASDFDLPDALQQTLLSRSSVGG